MSLCYNSVTTLLQFVFYFVARMLQLLKGILRSFLYCVGASSLNSPIGRLLRLRGLTHAVRSRDYRTGLHPVQIHMGRKPMPLFCRLTGAQ